MAINEGQNDHTLILGLGPPTNYKVCLGTPGWQDRCDSHGSPMHIDKQGQLKPWDYASSHQV